MPGRTCCCCCRRRCCWAPGGRPHLRHPPVRLSLPLLGRPARQAAGAGEGALGRVPLSLFPDSFSSASSSPPPGRAPGRSSSRAPRGPGAAVRQEWPGQQLAFCPGSPGRRSLPSLRGCALLLRIYAKGSPPPGLRGHLGKGKREAGGLFGELGRPPRTWGGERQTLSLACWGCFAQPRVHTPQPARASHWRAGTPAVELAVRREQIPSLVSCKGRGCCLLATPHQSSWDVA